MTAARGMEYFRMVAASGLSYGKERSPGRYLRGAGRICRHYIKRRTKRQVRSAASVTACNKRGGCHLKFAPRKPFCQPEDFLECGAHRRFGFLVFGQQQGVALGPGVEKTKAAVRAALQKEKFPSHCCSPPATLSCSLAWMRRLPFILPPRSTTQPGRT